MWLNKHDLAVIWEISWVDFKLRYNASVFGFLWSLLNPLLLLMVLYVIFGVLMDSEIEHYPLYLFIGIIIYNFFSEATVRGTASVIEKSSLVLKMNFKREILVLSACVTAFMSLLLHLVVLLAIMALSAVPFKWHIIFLPISLIQLFILALGVGFGLGAFYTKFRDIQHIWSFILQLGFFASPIFYPIKIVPVEYVKLYLLNPVTRIMTTARETLIHQYVTDYWNLGITLVMCLLVFGCGYALFNRRMKYFAEEI